MGKRDRNRLLWNSRRGIRASAASCSSVTNIPVIVGDRETIVLPPSLRAQFYRLAKPN